MRADIHPLQQKRLAALRSLGILDTPRESRFDSIVELAAELCDAPIAVINLIDENRQWFKAEVGLGIRETPLETSICSHVILQPGLTIIRDTLNDPRMCDNPLCFGEQQLRFYAGALLQTEAGLPLGTLCILDRVPRDLTDRQRRVLSVLADQVMMQIQLRHELRMADVLRKEVDHRVKNSLGLVGSLLGLQAKQSNNIEVTNALKFARDRVLAIGAIHDQLHASASGNDVDLSEFTDRLVAALAAQTRSDVTISATVPPMTLNARHAINLGIVVNELVSNALRHGFPEGHSGHIAVAGNVEGEKLRITIHDTGIGLPEGFDPASSKGLGMRVSRSLSQQFGSTLGWSSGDQGTTFSFDMPVQP